MVRNVIIEIAKPCPPTNRDVKRKCLQDKPLFFLVIQTDGAVVAEQGTAFQTFVNSV